jgi:ribosome biogenesis GTPase
LISLADLGFDTFFASHFDQLQRPGLVPARIAADGRGLYQLIGCEAQLGEPSGRMRFELDGTRRPAIGDWVAVADSSDRAVIHHLLPRKTVMSRRAADSDVAAQVIAANVDLFCIVTSANRDLNVRRIERYLTAVWDSGANPLVVLNKVDLVDDVGPMLDELASVALVAPVVQVSALTGSGLEDIRAQLGQGTTVAFVGSSGVGKSSLINRLLGRETQFVSAVREDDQRGRHTTTRRELIPLSGGGVLIDTPGMRELGLIEDEGGVDTVFADIAELSGTCRFADCAHESEPGCAIREALAIGALDADRWQSYRKLQREIAAAERRSDPFLAAEERRRWKLINKSMRANPKLARR